MNKEGFALTETLVVVVFLVTIFTFIYVSIVPLLGKYEGIIDREQDIDIVYKLYNIRKLIISDANKNTILSGDVKNIECNNLNKSSFCEKMMEHLELKEGNTNRYVLIYVDGLTSNNLNKVTNINSEIAAYAKKMENKINNRALFLLDTSKHTIAYLYC